MCYVLDAEGHICAFFSPEYRQVSEASLLCSLSIATNTKANMLLFLFSFPDSLPSKEDMLDTGTVKINAVFPMKDVKHFISQKILLC